MKTLTLFFVLLGGITFAQRDASSNMFWNNYSNINPAMSGMEYKMHGSVLHRIQWPSLSNTLRSSFINFNMRLKDKHGVGINYTNDRYSIWYTNKVSANYNYQMELGENSKLSVGAAASLNDFRTDYGKMTFSVPMEPEYRVTDINANLGVAYTWKKLLVHGSATNIFNSVLNSDDVASNFFDLRTFHIGAAYDFSLGERFSLKPQLLSQFTDGFIGLYLNTQFAFKDKYWIGATVGARDNYAFIAGWNVKEKFRVAYSYDRTISKLNNGFSAGSHEFSLGFYLK